MPFPYWPLIWATANTNIPVVYLKGRRCRSVVKAWLIFPFGREEKNEAFQPVSISSFDHYLPNIKGVSPHTIKSYRDTFRLFLPFAADYYGIKIRSLTSGATLIGVNPCIP